MKNVAQNGAPKSGLLHLLVRLGGKDVCIEIQVSSSLAVGDMMDETSLMSIHYV